MRLGKSNGCNHSLIAEVPMRSAATAVVIRGLCRGLWRYLDDLESRITAVD